ncbi:TonB family protein [Nitrospira sp. M1]
MTHASSANLISLGVSSSIPDEDSSIRWWIAGSLALHALIIIFLTTLRFAPTLEQPLHSYEVSLINPSDLEAPPAKSPAKTRSKPKPRQPQAPPTPPPKAKTRPPEPKAEPLAPLPTQSASERLSDSFSGAVKSVVVPNERSRPVPAETPPPPPTEAKPEPPNALESIKLPTTAPKLSRAQRLTPQPYVSIPDPAPKPPPTPKQEETTTPQPKPPAPTSAQQKPTKARQSLKAPPEAPILKPILPFTRAKRKESPEPQTEKLSDSFRKTIQSVKVPKLRKKSITKKPRKEPKLATPPTHTPFDRTNPTKKNIDEPPVKQERLADSLKQVLGTVKIPKLRSVPTKKQQPRRPIEPQQQASPRKPDTTRTQSLRSEIDQQLAKLTIPDVAPIESLKERLQVKVEAAPEPESSSSGSGTPKNSAGQNRYLALIEAKIEQKWVAPRVSLNEDHPQVILRFRVLPSGEVINLGIKQGSGNGYYDAAAKRAVKAASPLPPFPKDLKSSHLDLLYKFRIGESLS